MALDPIISTALANEARRQELRAKVAAFQGQVQATAMLSQSLANSNSDYTRQLVDARAQLAALEAGAGPGLTDDFGEYSSTDQAMRAERFAGKAASVDFVKANPTCTEDQVIPIYKAAALAARPPDRQWLLQDPVALRQEYAANLLKYGLIPDATWESWRAWIIATDRDVILGLN
jgi:hypothetical protein